MNKYFLFVIIFVWKYIVDIVLGIIDLKIDSVLFYRQPWNENQSSVCRSRDRYLKNMGFNHQSDVVFKSLLLLLSNLFYLLTFLTFNPYGYRIKWENIER